jgi:hypothetical protein
MDAHSSRHNDDLSDLERSLSGWRPDAEGLDAERMLFAAGLAAGKRGRRWLLWPAFCLFLAIQATGLGVWALAERAERQALASRLREGGPGPSAPPVTAVAVLAQPSYTPSPDDYFHLLRQMEQDPTGWLASGQPVGPQEPGPPPPQPVILTPRPPDGLYD